MKNWVFCTAMLLAGSYVYGAVNWPSSRLSKYLSKEESWYTSEEGKTAAENILSWQDDYGGWPKNLNTASKPFSGDRKELHGTFDNGATTGEMRFMAHMFRSTQDVRYQEAFLKGLDLIFKAQYPTGGWPQYFPPPEKSYHRHITFNDNTMVQIMMMLEEVVYSEEYSFVDTDRRTAAKEALERGIGCILKCQIRVDGQLTAWCAQHDEKDYSPRPARSYELASLSGGESTEILRLLMRIDNPSPPVVRSIMAGARWYEKSKIEGLRVKWISGKRTAVEEPGAPTQWARFYEIRTNRPFFCDRDGVPKYDYNQIDPERTEGYAWYGDWGKDLLEEYAVWKEKWKDRLSAGDSISIVLVGDSTVCVFTDPDWRRGWGQYIGEYFADNVEIANYAKSGRSTKTFLQEGLWDKALAEKPLFVLIQFGHNDNHAPEKPESTDANTDYPDNLRRYVEDARAVGATPILITPMHRRKFHGTGKMNDTLLPYADAMKKVAQEKKVAVVDLHTASRDLFEKIGEAESAKMSNDPADRTHFNEAGSRAMAELIIKQLPEVEPAIRPYLKNNDG
jgi:PelA/Pel-15E family pectate lyase